MSSRARLRLPLLALVLAHVLVACADDGGDMQCDAEMPDCVATLPATYDAIYDQVLSQSCGASGTGGSCHGPSGMQGGLVLLGREDAYRYLLGDAGGHARVVAGSPSCSLLMQRLDSDDAAYRMPRGAAKLSEGMRCAVRQWIAKGAER